MNVSILNIIKKTAAYMYLYIGYICIFYFFAYYLEDSCRPLGTVLVIFLTLIFFLIYTVINHRLIKHVISTGISVLFEMLLALTLIALLICYAFLWEKYDYLSLYTAP